MARKKKQTVNYFPHDCYHSKELQIIINKYGNKGYAFHYRLKELLGKTPNYGFVCNGDFNIEYISAETGTDIDDMYMILDTMTNIGLIDKELWETENIIWSEDFIESIEDQKNILKKFS